MTKAKTGSKKKAPRDVNQNVARIFGEMIERAEEPPKRGKLKSVPSSDQPSRHKP